MKILSLFDGIACARVAVERAGIPIEKYYASEIDKYAIKIAQKNYPDIIQVGDITKIKREYDFWGKPILRYGLNDIIEGIDLIIGGFPCQDLSIAKRNREGLKGKRSGLFWYMVDIVRFIRPKYFIFENVASMPKKDKAIITETLWGIEPVMIDAALVSAQRRRRLFWVGRKNGINYEKIDIPLPEDRGIYLKDILEDNPDMAPIKSKTIRVGGRGSAINDRHNWDTIRIGHLNRGGQGDRIYSIEGKSVCLSANGGGGGAKTGLYLIDWYNRKIKTDGKAKTLGTNPQCRTAMAGQSTTDLKTYIRKLTPIECERLQGLKDNYTEGISNTQRYKCLGNAFNVDVVAHILKYIKE